ncbi:MAG: GNAT family N-acetyltransferase [Burkholderiales bacterium]|nr:GNAT family N-acetyltransferase [Anaerolineae bacterium]
MNLDTNELRLLSKSDVDRAAEIMARAFYRDPLWDYIMPDEHKQAAQLAKTFRVFMTASIRNGQTYGAGDPIEGVAVWSAPNQKDGFAGLMGAGFLRLLFSPVALGFLKAGSMFGRAEAMQKLYAPEPHFYLNAIGVLPEAQGKGLASKLIRPFLARADAQGVSTYTETMTTSNVPLYEHYGFQCMEDYRVPKTELHLWALYRTVQR